MGGGAVTDPNDGGYLPRGGGRLRRALSIPDGPGDQEPTGAPSQGSPYGDVAPAQAGGRSGFTGGAPTSAIDRRLRPQTRALLAGFLVVLGIYLAGSFIHPSYVVFRAGPAIDTLGQRHGQDLIRISGAPTYPTTGSLDLTTVQVEGGPGYELTAWSYLRAKLDPEATISPRDEVYPDTMTREDVAAENRAEMSSSQEGAAAVAIRATGRTVPQRFLVHSVDPAKPAGSVLKAGDEIVSAAGKPVESTEQLSKAIQTVPAGRPVRLRITREGRPLDVQVGTVQDGTRRIIGVIGVLDYDLPLTVTIDPGEVGGPSAGLMFALGTYDKLTPGELTGGQRIAGTGTITGDGRVGKIGGIDHKMTGAAEAGVGWFLAPAGNCRDVAGHVPDGLRVASVATFTEAKATVEAIAAGRVDEVKGCPAS